jgi:hypothetical protein
MKVTAVQAVPTTVATTRATSVTQAAIPSTSAVSAVTSQAIEGLRGELARPFEFLGDSGCPWKGGKPPKGS